MQVDDRLEIGSNTKSFVIAVLMQLQEEGLLSFDDMLSDWLPDLAAQIPNGDQITLRQLAAHTSGIWDYGDPIIGEAANDPARSWSRATRPKNWCSTPSTTVRRISLRAKAGNTATPATSCWA